MTNARCPEITDYELTAHALNQMRRRGVDGFAVSSTLRHPGQRIRVRPGRCVYQAIVTTKSGHGDRLPRVFVDVDRDPPEVVTVYVTTKIDKYWSEA